MKRMKEESSLYIKRNFYQINNAQLLNLNLQINFALS